MNVASILKHKGTDIIAAKKTDSISVVAGILNEHRIGAVLVLDENRKVLGVLSERDIVKGLAARGDGCLTMEAGQLMTADVITCTLADTVDQVMALMTKKRIRHLPVMDGDSLAGFISIGDVVKARMDEVEREAAAMRDYIATG